MSEVPMSAKAGEFPRGRTPNGPPDLSSLENYRAARKAVELEYRRAATRIGLALLLPSLLLALWWWSPSQQDRRWRAAVLEEHVIVPVRRATGEDISKHVLVKNASKQMVYLIEQDPEVRERFLTPWIPPRK